MWSVNSNLTDKEAAAPLVLVQIDGHGEDDVASDEQGRGDTDGRVGPYHVAFNRRGVELALDGVTGREAGARDVDQCATHHVGVIRGERQWEYLALCNVANCYRVSHSVAKCYRV